MATFYQLFTTSSTYRHQGARLRPFNETAPFSGSGVSADYNARMVTESHARKKLGFHRTYTFWLIVLALMILTGKIIEALFG